MNKEEVLKLISKNLNKVLLNLKDGFSCIGYNIIIKQHLIDILLYNRINQCYILVYAKTDLIEDDYLEEIHEAVLAVNEESNTVNSMAIVITSKINKEIAQKSTNKIIDYIFYQDHEKTSSKKRK